MNSILVAAMIALSTSAMSAERLRTDSPSSDPNYPYRGSSGAEYKYDLSKPADQTRYGIDPGAQIRDSISVDPRRDLDRSLGQQGGGARR